MDQKQVSRLSCRGISTAALLGFVAVAAARLLTLPRSVWELDETLFMSGVLDFEPLRHHPHPPGYPLLIGLGKLFALVLNDPFQSLVALSVVASLIGYAALVSAFRRPAGAGPGARRRAGGGARGACRGGRGAGGWAGRSRALPGWSRKSRSWRWAARRCSTSLPPADLWAAPSV